MTEDKMERERFEKWWSECRANLRLGAPNGNYLDAWDAWQAALSLARPPRELLDRAQNVLKERGEWRAASLIDPTNPDSPLYDAAPASAPARQEAVAWRFRPADETRWRQSGERMLAEDRAARGWIVEPLYAAPATVEAQPVARFDLAWLISAINVHRHLPRPTGPDLPKWCAESDRWLREASEMLTRIHNAAPRPIRRRDD